MFSSSSFWLSPVLGDFRSGLQLVFHHHMIPIPRIMNPINTISIDIIWGINWLYIKKTSVQRTIILLEFRKLNLYGFQSNNHLLWFSLKVIPMLSKYGVLIGVTLGGLIGIRSIFSDHDSDPNILTLLLPLIFWSLIGCLIGHLVDRLIKAFDRYISEPKYPGPH